MGESPATQESTVSAVQGASPEPDAQLRADTYRVLGNPDASLDVVQDAFVKIHKNIGSWDRRSRFFSWSYRVVTNLAIDSLRKKGRERKAWENRAATQLVLREGWGPARADHSD